MIYGVWNFTVFIENYYAFYLLGKFSFLFYYL